MNDPVFKIKYLKCAYIPNNPVMEIEDLVIPRGKLLFVIGKSGIGKSTFIETLGLMNNTIASDDQTSILFYPADGSEQMELKDSWSMPNEKLAAFRKNHFSFIFQNTNLMPNFSSGENMMMSLLINGKSREEAKAAVLRVMNRLSLPEEVFDKRITALSGGQRQRLAFVRAVTANFTVLFGDEPTGNLDENTADELMTILKQLIQEESKTCVIVSHDLKLTQNFADIVIPITLNPINGIGEIKPSNIVRRDAGNWTKNNGQQIENPMNYFNEFLSGKPTEVS